MAFSVNKTRILQVAGLDDISITAPVVEWKRFDNIGNGKVVVILNIYQDQAAFEQKQVQAKLASLTLNNFIGEKSMNFRKC